MIKQVIVVRADIFKNCRRGKENIQACHASIAFLTRRLQKQLEAEKGKIAYVDKIDPLHPDKTIKVPVAFLSTPGGLKKIKDLFSQVELEWMTEVSGGKNFTKISVQVENEQELDAIYEKAKTAGLEVHMIIDSGATEFHGVPTKTVVAIGPDISEKIDKITGDLKLR